MGGKPTRARKHVQIYTAVLLISLVAAGCHPFSLSKKEGPQKRDDSSIHLSYGKRLFAEGDFAGAARELERIAFFPSKTPITQEAILYLGVVHADAANPKRDHGRAMLYFRRLSDGGYPRSVFTEQARMMLAILRENDESTRTIERLKGIIEAAKKVDREIEEKRREKTGK